MDMNSNENKIDEETGDVWPVILCLRSHSV